MKRILIGLIAAGLLAGCSNDFTAESPPEMVSAAVFREAGPKSITVYTMVNNRTGTGGHSAMKVTGSQTVIFDPAGSFRHSKVAERGDVIFGVTPGLERSYKSAHARSAYHVVSQKISLSDAQAEQALRMVLSNGAVPGAYCANATTGILSRVDGLSGIKQTFYPLNLMEQMSRIPGVQTTRHYENDEGDILDGVRAAEAAALE